MISTLLSPHLHAPSSAVWALAAMACLSLSPPSARAQSQLFAPARRPPYIAPNRLFQLTLPERWEAKTFKDQPGLVEFRFTAPYAAWVQVRHLSVPAGARPKQLALRGRDQRLRKLPHFELQEERDLEVHGVPAATLTGTYWYQGNAQYPRMVEEMYLVSGTDAFVFHFECFEPAADAISGDLNHIYDSFVPRPEAMTTPTVEENPLDTIPF